MKYMFRRKEIEDLALSIAREYIKEKLKEDLEDQVRFDYEVLQGGHKELSDDALTPDTEYFYRLINYFIDNIHQEIEEAMLDMPSANTS